MPSLLDKLRFAADRLRPLDLAERRFVRHNRRIWPQRPAQDAGGEILVEICSVASTVIAFSYFVNVLADRHEAAITGYGFRPQTLKTILIDRRFKQLYRSFGVSRFVYPETSRGRIAEKRRLLERLGKALVTKRDIEALTIDGVWVGDLVYDSHLMDYRVPTIDPRGAAFAATLAAAVDTYLFWRDYLNAHRVRAIVMSHTVYIPAILVRLAVQRGIACYQVNAAQLYRLDRHRIMAYNEHFDYHEQFLDLPADVRRQGLLEARARLDQRFSGKVGVDMHYSSKSAYTRRAGAPVLRNSDKVKILVAPHCFFDSPHPYGVNLFPDFYEWLDFLGKISEVTDYEWYIKTHPDFLPGNIPIIREFISRYPKFTFIPSDTSHLQIIEEGIDVALSVYGTIGFEYAALGVPVIYASRCNPCIAYDFNLHPRSIDEFAHLLMNLKTLSHPISIESVYEFYFMRFIYSDRDWLFGDYDRFLAQIGGYARQFGSISYVEFLEQLDQGAHRKTITCVSRFIASKDYYYQQKYKGNTVASPSE